MFLNQLSFNLQLFSCQHIIFLFPLAAFLYFCLYPSNWLLFSSYSAAPTHIFSSDEGHKWRQVSLCLCFRAPPSCMIFCPSGLLVLWKLAPFWVCRTPPFWFLSYSEHSVFVTFLGLHCFSCTLNNRRHNPKFNFGLSATLVVSFSPGIYSSF